MPDKHILQIIVGMPGRRRALIAAAVAVAVALAVVGIALSRHHPARAGQGVDAITAATATSATPPTPSGPSTSPRTGTSRATTSAPATTHAARHATSDAPAGPAHHAPTTAAPPRRGGYFTTEPVGVWSTLPSDATCAARVRYSSWEPRPANTPANRTTVDAAAVHQSFAARPVSASGSYDARWDSWLLQRVDGQFSGTTDETFQWAACKWGLSDDVLRAIAVRESTWYQYESYPSARPVVDWGSGDMMPAGTAGAGVYCTALARYGHDYRADFGASVCPETFSIAGVMSWQSPSWGQMPDNQNGTFPFNRNSTAFALDYVASYLRGCYDGWARWLGDSGTYAAGDLWGCVGSWFSGDWHSSAANGYISRVRNELRNFTWLASDWPSVKPSCSPAYGCPVPGRH